MTDLAKLTDDQLKEQFVAAYIDKENAAGRYHRQQVWGDGASGADRERKAANVRFYDVETEMRKRFIKANPDEVKELESTKAETEPVTPVRALVKDRLTRWDGSRHECSQWIDSVDFAKKCQELCIDYRLPSIRKLAQACQRHGQEDAKRWGRLAENSW